MGTWGPGLYACDFAKDLKSTVSAILSLPYSDEQIVAILAETFPEASQRQEDEDYTAFWLVLADQFHKRGVAAAGVFEKAFEIIDTGIDARMPQHLEMSESDQKKRAKTLSKLRDKLGEPVSSKQRKTLSKPQRLVMNLGDVFVYPVVETGGCFNPYLAKSTWERAGWGVAVIVTCGHVFDYLAYYCPVVIDFPLNVDDCPSLDVIHDLRGWRLRRPGTCSPAHFKRMQIQVVGRLEIDCEKRAKHFPEMRDGSYAAINDISISNWLHVGENASHSSSDFCIDSLSDITS